MGVLSWASISHDIAIIRLSDFYSLFIELQKEFPDLIQELGAVTQRGELSNFTYSIRLCDAVEASLQIGMRITADFQHLYTPKQAANLSLERLRKRVGNEFVDNLQPVADRLAELMNPT